jgi:hypothetical protein
MKTNGQKTFRKFQTTTALVAALGMALVGPAQAGRVTGNLGGSGVALPGSAPTGSASHGDLELNEQLLLSDQFDGSWIDESLAMSIAGKKRYLSHQACPQLPDGTNCLSISVGDDDDYSTWTILDNSCTKKRAGKSKQFKSSCWKGYQALHLAQVQIDPVETVDVSATQLDVFSESVSKVFVPNGAQMRFTHTVETMWQKHLSLSTEGTYRLNYEQVTESLYDASGAPVVDEDNPLCTGGDYHDECTDMEIYIRPMAAKAGSDAGASTTMDGTCNQNFESQLIELEAAANDIVAQYEQGAFWLTVSAGLIGGGFTYLGMVSSLTMSGAATAASAFAPGAWQALAVFSATGAQNAASVAAGWAYWEGGIALASMAHGVFHKKQFHKQINKQAEAFIEEYDLQRLDCIDAAIGACAIDADCVCEDSFEDEDAADECETQQQATSFDSTTTVASENGMSGGSGSQCQFDSDCKVMGESCIENTCQFQSLF